MDGKIIQEVEGIVNGSGFVKMSEPVQITGNQKYTITTEFVPKVVLVSTKIDGAGLGIKPCERISGPGQYIMLSGIVWSENSVTFSTNNLTYIVTVLG